MAYGQDLAVSDLCMTSARVLSWGERFIRDATVLLRVVATRHLAENAFLRRPDAHLGLDSLSAVQTLP